MQRPKWIPRWLHVPQLIVIGFIVWMMVAGENNYVRTKAMSTEVNNLKMEIQAKRDSAIYYERKVQELNTDAETMERIAREQYGMCRESEDVYVVTE